MPQIIMGECDEQSCKKVFPLNNGGFKMSISFNETTGEITIVLSKPKEGEISNSAMVCGRNCLQRN